jgi:hypothetical protein
MAGYSGTGNRKGRQPLRPAGTSPRHSSTPQIGPSGVLAMLLPLPRLTFQTRDNKSKAAGEMNGNSRGACSCRYAGPSPTATLSCAMRQDRFVTWPPLPTSNHPPLTAPGPPASANKPACTRLPFDLKAVGTGRPGVSGRCRPVGVGGAIEGPRLDVVGQQLGHQRVVVLPSVARQ